LGWRRASREEALWKFRLLYGLGIGWCIESELPVLASGRVEVDEGGNSSSCGLLVESGFGEFHNLT
jgi:hypothetical protein